MKPDSSFSKLPSISELLKHPTVARVVERVNQTTIAQRATGFLDELQVNLRHRMEMGQVPSIGQLAERLARRLLGPATVASPIVNATGVVLGQPWASLPLAESAVNELTRVATEYHRADDLLLERTLRTLRELTGAEAAWVVHHYDAALQLARETSPGDAEAAGHLGLLNPETYGLASCDTLSARLADGAALLVAEGAGLLGGPRCGIILGKQELVQKVRDHPQAALLVPQATILAALAATLDCYRNEDRVSHQVPVWQLLSTPLENLQQRAERLAALMDESKLIGSAEPLRCDSTWCDTPNLKIAGPSWAIAVRPVDGGVDKVLDLLQDATPQIVGRMQRGGLLLDLRSVFPRWDQHLVKVIVNRQSDNHQSDS